MCTLSPTFAADRRGAAAVLWSAVVERRLVQAENRALPLSLGPGKSLRRYVVHFGGRPDTLGEIAPPVVHLQEVPAAAPCGGGAAVPRVGDEQGDVARPPDEEHGGTTVVG